VNFAVHVMVTNSANADVRELQIRGEGLVVTAPPPEVAVMINQSRNVVVENNTIYNTGLGIFVRGGMSWGNRIAHNTITAGANGILGSCYNPFDGDPQSPRADLIYANHIANYNIGIQMAATAAYNIIRENTLVVRATAIDDQGTGNRLLGNVDLRLQ
jgi:parallel beta-helix repeat protein